MKLEEREEIKKIQTKMDDSCMWLYFNYFIFRRSQENPKFFFKPLSGYLVRRVYRYCSLGQISLYF